MIFPKNFLDFRFNRVEKQSIINLSSFSSKSYVSLVIGDSEIIFVGEGEDSAFCPLVNHVLFTDIVE